jgi:hypothetical protein
MKKTILTVLAVLALNGVANAASVINRDADPVTLLVTEGSDKVELSVGPGETVEFCSAGCFMTLPNGDREVLTGAETVEISGGAASIK